METATVFRSSLILTHYGILFEGMLLIVVRSPYRKLFVAGFVGYIRCSDRQKRLPGLQR